jgi:hypothetical protein
MEPTATAGAPDELVRPLQGPSTAGVGFGVAQAIQIWAPRGLIGLEGAMRKPEEVLVMQLLLERDWSQRRILSPAVFTL